MSDATFRLEFRHKVKRKKLTALEYAFPFLFVSFFLILTENPFLPTNYLVLFNKTILKFCQFD